MPIDKATGKRRESTIEERVEVIAKRAAGKTFTEIAQETGVSRAESQRIWANWKSKQKLFNEKRPGRPRKLTETERQQLKKLAEEDPDASIAELTRRMGGKVSRVTVQRYLRQMGLKTRRRKKPKIRRVWIRRRTKEGGSVIVPKGSGLKFEGV
ncbi:hypothetical protein FN846DRAFT_935575 [Sphaerosporella brunnea]|uniref:Transposase Tc1-like domain-containing protein n=1 Tax=Sphaerosporella brunnea TaxID=1250544 RepID=A0A5J5F611_9PEZI|nr:hypothetical protein FN846DRAFT_935575 [Sphaerosporella brunnea]